MCLPSAHLKGIRGCRRDLSFGKSVKEIGQMLLMQGMMVLNNINNAFHDDHHPMHFSHTTMAPYMEK